MIEYVYSVEEITAAQLHGFFVGWPNPPSPEVHLELLIDVTQAFHFTSGRGTPWRARPSANVRNISY